MGIEDSIRSLEGAPAGAPARRLNGPDGPHREPAGRDGHDLTASRAVAPSDDRSRAQERLTVTSPERRVAGVATPQGYLLDLLPARPQRALGRRDVGTPERTRRDVLRRATAKSVAVSLHRERARPGPVGRRPRRGAVEEVVLFATTVGGRRPRPGARAAGRESCSRRRQGDARTVTASAPETAAGRRARVPSERRTPAIGSGAGRTNAISSSATMAALGPPMPVDWTVKAHRRPPLRCSPTGRGWWLNIFGPSSRCWATKGSGEGRRAAARARPARRPGEWLGRSRAARASDERYCS